MVLRAEQVCGYDLDDVDQAWLTAVNGERTLSGQPSITGKQHWIWVEVIPDQKLTRILPLKNNPDPTFKKQPGFDL